MKVNTYTILFTMTKFQTSFTENGTLCRLSRANYRAVCAKKVYLLTVRAFCAETEI